MHVTLPTSLPNTAKTCSIPPINERKPKQQQQQQQQQQQKNIMITNIFLSSLKGAACAGFERQRSS
jgi:hypothetical protein